MHSLIAWIAFTIYYAGSELFFGDTKMNSTRSLFLKILFKSQEIIVNYTWQMLLSEVCPEGNRGRKKGIWSTLVLSKIFKKHREENFQKALQRMMNPEL